MGMYESMNNAMCNKVVLAAIKDFQEELRGIIVSWYEHAYDYNDFKDINKLNEILIQTSHLKEKMQNNIYEDHSPIISLTIDGFPSTPYSISLMSHINSKLDSVAHGK